MGGTRFGRTRSIVHMGRQGRLFARSRVARSIGLLAVLLMAMLALGSAGASAEPLCTDTWTGSSEGAWQTASNWSAGHTPTSSDVACIGAGTTVNVSEGANQAGVVVDKGTLTISSGSSLEIASALEPSSVSTLALNSGTLSGAATVDVSSSLSWTNGKMTGLGSAVVQSGASASLASGGQLKLEGGWRYINEGTTTFSEGQIRMAEGAELKNTGTFKANSQSGSPQFRLETEAKGAAPLILNTGTFEKTAGVGATEVEIDFENHGTVDVQDGQLQFRDGGSSTSAGIWEAVEGSSVDFVEGSFSLSGGSLKGLIDVNTSVSVEGVHGESAQLAIPFGSLTITGGSMTVASFTQSGGSLKGSGTLDVSGTLSWSAGRMLGSGATVVKPGASGTLPAGGLLTLEGRAFVNEGTTTFPEGQISMAEGAEIRNTGTFKANSQSGSPQFRVETEAKGSEPLIVNSGTFEKTAGTGTTEVDVEFENQGTIKEETGKFKFFLAVLTASSTQYGGPENPSADSGQQHSSCGKPVSCATGNESESQTDFAIGGRGVGLDLTRYYNSQAAAEGAKGVFGYGWTSSFSDHLVINKTSKVATLYQADGSTVPFTEESGGSFVAPAWSQDVLSGTEAGGYTLTLAEQTKYKFAGSSGRLESVTDRDGNATTLAYNAEGHLETITDPVSRKIKLKYDAEGLVESAEDPMGHVVKYTYEGGNLKSVTQPAEVSLRWQFKYNGSNEMTEMIDGRGGKTINEYSGKQVVSQEDPAERTLTFAYEPFQTKITNKVTGSVTDERFTSSDEPYSVTRGYETSSATTETFTYNTAGQVLTATDGNGHTTSYGYDAAGDRTSMVDPDKDETKWTYDSTHDVETMTTPGGETTTIKRESHGNPESIERPAPGGKTQTTKYKYTAHGELESVTNPLEHTWKYEYDSKGDRSAEIDPETNKRNLGIQRRLASDRDRQPSGQRQTGGIHDQNRTRCTGPPADGY